MTAVRGTRVIAIVLGCLLAVAMAVIGGAAPSSAAAGEISGQVVDPALTGLDGLTVIIDDGSDPPAYQTVSTSGGGYFSYAPPADGDYDVVVLGGDDHLDYNSEPISYELATAASGDLGQIVLDPGTRITGIVRDAATGLPVEGVVVFATDATFTDLYPALPPTDATGLYSLAVPPGHDYYLIALDGNLFSATGDAYDPQFWDHVNVSTLTGCSCMLGDPVSVTTVWPGTAITDIDFDLLSYSDWIYFSVYAERLPGPVEYAGITIHLDKWNAGTSTWDPMASDVTDADGYADLFGLGAGDYRIRYTKGSAALAVISYDDYSGGPFPLYGGGTWIEFPTLYPTSPGCGCGPSGFEEQDVDLLFPKPASGGSGGGTPPPRSTGGVVSTVVSATPTPTPTSTPSPSATPTSTPAPGPTSSAEPIPTPTPDPVPGSDAGFPWWILLLIVLGLGIMITIVIIVRRR